VSITEYDALEDFAGPGGWDEGAKMLGLHFFGVDYDKAACETARAAGHVREQADVTAHESPAWARGKGHVSSPSCTLFSMAGSGIGRLVIAVLIDATKSILTGADPAAVREMAQGAIYPVALAEAEAKNEKRKPEKKWSQEKVEEKARLDAKVAALVLEPARRIMELGPEWVALEQVPEVLPIWDAYRTVLSNQGWSVWTGVMNAADYGVPQTRRRAILIASRVRQVAPPEPTHAEHPQGDDLFGTSMKTWVTLAEALEPFGWSPFDAIHPARGEGMIERHGDRPDHPGSEPAPTVISKARSWVRVNNRTSTTGDYYRRPTDRPSPTIVTAASRWVYERPATTVVGSFKPEVIAAPGYRTETSRQDAPGSVSVSVSEAGVLQSFRPDYEWTGSRSKQYEQVGNAIPPLLAAHVLAAATGLVLDVAA
jgi:DNA (cytosine-5)-methyltransferase 1